MVDLLNTFDIKTVILVVFMVAIAIKEIIELINYFHKKLMHKYEQYDDSKEREEDIDKSLHELIEIVENGNKKIDLLQQSNRDSIKSWIVMLYHKYKKNPIELDAMQMDLLERRYAHYKNEGGNSYVDQLMEELREIYKEKGESNVSV